MWATQFFLAESPVLIYLAKISFKISRFKNKYRKLYSFYNGYGLCKRRQKIRENWQTWRRHIWNSLQSKGQDNQSNRCSKIHMTWEWGRRHALNCHERNCHIEGARSCQHCQALRCHIWALVKVTWPCFWVPGIRYEEIHEESSAAFDPWAN